MVFPNNIISIDLDIIMSPFCAIYTDNIIDVDDREFLWKTINEIYNVYDFIPDITIIEKLKKLISLYSQKVDKVYIGYNHSSILNAINDNKELFNNNYKFDLYNIDFHHDMCYGEKEKYRVIDQGLPSCGSWVGFLNFNQYIDNYYWYCGSGSSLDKRQVKEGNECFVKNLFINRFDQSEFPENLDPKILYITPSPPWIPPHLDIIVNDILNCVPEEKKVILDGSYSINYDRKNFLDKMDRNEQNNFKRYY